MTVEEVTGILKEKIPYRRPVKYARSGDTWYIYTENVENGGHHLPVIENGWFSVEGNKVLPVYPVDMPRDLNLLSIPYNLRQPKFVDDMD